MISRGTKMILLGMLTAFNGTTTEGLARIKVPLGIAVFILGIAIVGKANEDCPIRRYNKKKLLRELFYLGVAILGLVMIIVGIMLDNQPGMPIKLFFSSGILITALSVACFEEVRQGKKRKKNTRRRRHL